MCAVVAIRGALRPVLWASWSCLVLVPTIPLFAASILYDNTFKRYNPDANQNSFGVVPTLAFTINFTYVCAALVYLLFTCLVKGFRARNLRESQTEKKLRQFFNGALFVTLFCAVIGASNILLAKNPKLGLKRPRHHKKSDEIAT